MRVLILLDDSDSETARETVFRRWSRLIPLLSRRCGEVITVTLRERGPLHGFLDANGYVSLALRSGSRWQTPLAIARLARFLRTHPVDIVHGHETIPAVVAGVAGLCSRPSTRRVYFREFTEGSTLQNLVSRFATTLTSATMGASRTVARYAIDVDGADTRRVSVVPNGVEPLRPVDVNEVQGIKNQLGIPPQGFVVLCVARLRVEKGIDVLIQAMEELGHRATGGVHLVVVGSGPEKERLVGQVSATSSFVSHFVGHMSDLAPWYATADVVCVPSRREAFGLVAIEAMAAAKPVVASRVGGLSETIEEGINGLLVEARSARALADALDRLRVDKAERLRLGGEGRRRFEATYTLEAMADRWVEQYRRLVDEEGVRTSP